MSASVGLSLGTSTLDPTLDQLFSTSRNSGAPRSNVSKPPPRRKATATEVEVELSEEGSSIASSDEEGSSQDDPSDDENDESASADDSEESSARESADEGEDGLTFAAKPQRKRKRAKEPDIEDVYMAKLSRDSGSLESRPKKARLNGNESMTEEASDLEADPADASSDDDVDNDDVAGTNDEDEDEYEIPKHETQDETSKGSEVEKAARTVFVGNVSSEAITSKEALRELKAHLSSFFDSIKTEGGKTNPKIESFRFRSVAFSTTSIPRKAAFAKREVMDATTRSTNVYVVYNSVLAAREAVKRLNGTVVLDRHLRVDGVAHPSPVDHRRCVFVGNLGFVDDESLILAAEEEQRNADEETPKRKKKNRQPADIEEGLWRTFAKVGTVESVRVVRDKTTRVGKGIAYVQFTDQVAVEKALQLDGKAFPPMLPRSLRVTRARKPSKTAGAMERQKSQAMAAMKAANTNNSKMYNPRVDTNARTMSGRAAKLLGRAGAAQMKNGSRIRAPEGFVFEGYRATNRDGKGTMNLKPIKSGKKKKSTKPSSRNSKRAAAFKAQKKQS